MGFFPAKPWQGLKILLAGAVLCSASAGILGSLVSSTNAWLWLLLWITFLIGISLGFYGFIGQSLFIYRDINKFVADRNAFRESHGVDPRDDL